MKNVQTITQDTPTGEGDISPKSLTWEYLVSLEPRLADMLIAAQAVKDDKRRQHFCANDVWFGRGAKSGLKHVLMGYVGWDALGHPDLRSCEAYDLAYQTVYDALPDCRNCGCMVW